MYVSQAAQIRHYALNRLHRLKNTKYLSRCTEINSSFICLWLSNPSVQCLMTW